MFVELTFNFNNTSFSKKKKKLVKYNEILTDCLGLLLYDLQFFDYIELKQKKKINK